VAVQTGNIVSNVGSIAVAPGGGACLELAGLGTDVTALPDSVVVGRIALDRAVARASGAAATVDTTTDTGTASFSYAAALPAVWQSLGGSAGSCTVTLTTNGVYPVAARLPPDAGPSINVSGPAGARQMTKQGPGSYSGTFASMTNVAIPGLPPITRGGPGFLEPGAVVVQNGAGADIGAFSVSVKNPQPLSWDNRDGIAAVDRKQGVTVRWSGGDPGGQVTAGGRVTQLVAGLELVGTFTCTAQAGAGQLVVPPFVTLGLPAGDGTLTVAATVGQAVTAAGVDLAQVSSTERIGKNVAYR
jgi:hypothetical protein